jgi:hypothetical protein
MLAMLVFAAITHCATADLCPTDTDLLNAVRSRDAAATQAAADQASAGGDIVLVHTQRIRRISDVICGDELTEQPQTITCSFKVRYWSNDAYQVAKLVKRANGWEITDSLGVTRERK